MKKPILICLLALLALAAKSQKLEKPEIDKLSGDTTIQTSVEKIFTASSFSTMSTQLLYVSIAKLSSYHYRMTFKVLNSNGITVFSINKGDKVYLKFSDNRIDTLTNDLSEMSETDVKSSNNVVGTAFVSLFVSKSDMERIKASNIAFIRIETSKGNFDYDIKPKNAEIIKKEVQLIAGI